MNKCKNIDNYSEAFYYGYLIFGILSIIFTIIDILKEIHESIMLKKEYLFDIYNFPAIIGSVLKLTILFRDKYLIYNDYSHDLDSTN
jgi:hypothetical protein